VIRWCYFRRDTKTWVFQFVVPGIFVLIGLFLIQTGGSQIFNVPTPTYTLTVKDYNPKVRAGRSGPQVPMDCEHDEPVMMVPRSWGA
jgi:hypothetical protein